jgi:hypothetical protein
VVWRHHGQFHRPSQKDGRYRRAAHFGGHNQREAAARRLEQLDLLGQGGVKGSQRAGGWLKYRLKDRAATTEAAVKVFAAAGQVDACAGSASSRHPRVAAEIEQASMFSV